MKLLYLWETVIQFFTMWQCPTCGEVWSCGPKVCPKCDRGKWIIYEKEIEQNLEGG